MKPVSVNEPTTTAIAVFCEDATSDRWFSSNNVAV